MTTHDLRVLTLNLWSVGGIGPERRAALVAGIRGLAPDLVAFQEAFKTDGDDSAAAVVGPDYHVVHQTTGLLDDGNCAAVASRWPPVRVHELDQRVTPRTHDFPATTLLVEVDVPGPVGRVLFVNHLPSWKPQLELERELQTVAAARFVEDAVAESALHVVLAGDLDATPDAASIRFLSARQSLDGMSVWYRDAWETLHPDDPGHTFTLRNPLVSQDTDARMQWSRRIDYVFVRCDENGPTLEIAACELAFDRPIDGAWASDHFGVVADLRVPQPR